MNIGRIGAGAWLPPFLLLGLISSAFAEETNEETETLEHVQVTATRRAANEYEVAAAASVVGAFDIQEDSPDVLAEALRGTPGAWFQQTTPGQGIPIIRGLKGSQVLHMVDGMRLNNAFFRSAPNQYLGLVDPYMESSIEVVRGASGALYGSDAMGGVVNFVSQDLLSGSQRDTQDWHLYGAWNSADNGLASRIAFTTRSGDTALRAGFSYQDRGDRTTGAGETLSPSGFRSRAADVSLQHQLDSQSELVIRLQALEQPSTPRIDELLPGYGQSEPASEEFFFEPNERQYLHARYSRDDGGWYDRFQINFAHQQMHDDRRSRDSGSSNRRLEQNRSSLNGLTIQFDHEFGNDSWMTWGAELYKDKVSSARQQVDITNGQVSNVRSRFPDASTMDSMAVYASWEWQATPRLDVIAGARYSSFDIDLAATSSSVAATLDPDDVSGDVHFSWAWTDDTRIVANFGRGFRAPNIFDLGTLGERPGNRFNISNPTLGPETVWSYDLGIKHQSGRFQAELYGFYMDYEDKITSVSTGQVTDSGRDIVRSENRETVTLYGIEAGARWQQSDHLDWFATLNLTRGTEDDNLGTTQDADRIPPLNGKIGLTWQFQPDTSIELSGLFARRQDRLSNRDISDPRINPEGSPGWVVVDISLRREISDRLSAGVRLENIGDNDYREHASGVDARGRNLAIWLSADL